MLNPQALCSSCGYVRLGHPQGRKGNLDVVGDVVVHIRVKNFWKVTSPLVTCRNHYVCMYVAPVEFHMNAYCRFKQGRSDSISWQVIYADSVTGCP